MGAGVGPGSHTGRTEPPSSEGAGSAHPPVRGWGWATQVQFDGQAELTVHGMVFAWQWLVASIVTVQTGGTGADASTAAGGEGVVGGEETVPPPVVPDPTVAVPVVPDPTLPLPVQPTTVSGTQVKPAPQSPSTVQGSVYRGTHALTIVTLQGPASGTAQNAPGGQLGAETGGQLSETVVWQTMSEAQSASVEHGPGMQPYVTTGSHG